MTVEIDFDIIKYALGILAGLVFWYIKQVDAKINKLFAKQDRIRLYLLKRTDYNELNDDDGNDQ